MLYPGVSEVALGHPIACLGYISIPEHPEVCWLLVVAESHCCLAWNIDKGLSGGV
jgi:hypothetical protein